MFPCEKERNIYTSEYHPEYGSIWDPGVSVSPWHFCSKKCIFAFPINPSPVMISDILQRRYTKSSTILGWTSKKASIWRHFSDLSVINRSTRISKKHIQERRLVYRPYGVPKPVLDRCLFETSQSSIFRARTDFSWFLSNSTLNLT